MNYVQRETCGACFEKDEYEMMEMQGTANMDWIGKVVAHLMRRRMEQQSARNRVGGRRRRDCCDEEDEADAARMRVIHVCSSFFIHFIRSFTSVEVGTKYWNGFKVHLGTYTVTISCWHYLLLLKWPKKSCVFSPFSRGFHCTKICIIWILYE
jgi:hypothetical protein